MSAQKNYLRCACPQCAGHIEYPDYTAGGVMNCPHCGQSMRLPAAPPVAPPPAAAPPVVPKPPPVPPPQGGAGRAATGGVSQRDTPHLAPAAKPKSRRVAGVLGVVVAALVLLVVAGGLVKHIAKKAKAARDAQTESPASQTQDTPSAPPESSKSSTTPSPAKPPEPASPAKSATGLKSIGDLKVSDAISLEEPKGAKGSKLVYATGTVKNESDAQRFGVRVEVDLLDPSGAKVGTATDYVASIEPRATWRFRALIVERKATGAKLAKITEDN